jgi:hypothetical protein
MYREGSILELPINQTTSESDLFDILRKEKFYQKKHPTIKLIPEQDALAAIGMVLLFAALLLLEKERNLKPSLKKKNKAPFLDSDKMNAEENIEQLIEQKFNVHVIIGARPTEKYEEKSEGSLDSVFGIWKGRKVSVDKIREEQWGRKR